MLFSKNKKKKTVPCPACNRPGFDMFGISCPICKGEKIVTKATADDFKAIESQEKYADALFSDYNFTKQDND